MEYTLIYFIIFDETNRICVCKRIKTTKLVQACSSSAMSEQHGSTRSSRLARQSRTCRAKWNLAYTIISISFNPEVTQLSPLCCRSEFQELQLLFQHVICAPASSAPIERIFSQSSLLVRPHRARTTDSLLERLMLLKCSVKLCPADSLINTILLFF